MVLDGDKAGTEEANINCCWILPPFANKPVTAQPCWVSLPVMSGHVHDTGSYRLQRSLPELLW